MNTRGRAHGLLPAVGKALAGLRARTAALETLPVADPTEPPRLVLDPGGHTATCRDVLFTPDGRELVSVGDDKVVRVWDAATGEARRTLHLQMGAGQEGMLYAAALSPDGRTLAVGGYGTPDAPEHWGDIRLLDLHTGEVRRLLQGHANVINALAFAPDGATLASGSSDQSVRLWNLRTGECRRVLEGHEDCIYGLAWSPDGRQLASASDDGTARVWNAKSGALIHVLQEHADAVKGVAWSRLGLIATGSSDGTIGLWDAQLGTLQHALPRQTGRVRCVAFSPDGQRLICGLGSSPFSVQVWSAPEGRLEREFEQHDNTVHRVAFAPDGQTVVSTGGDRSEIYVWDPGTGEIRHGLHGTGAAVWSVGWSADGTQLGWSHEYGNGSLQQSFDLANLGSGPDITAVDGWLGAVHELGGRRIAPSADRNSVLIYEGGREVGRGQRWNTQGRVRCCSFTPDGAIVVGSDFHLARYAAAGERATRFVGHTGMVWALAVSPDGRYLASGGKDQTLRVWSLQTGADTVEPLLSLFRGSDGEWVAWTPDGYYAASLEAERIIGWHLNGGFDRAAECYPAYQFRRRFYRPDVIARLLEAGSVAEAVRLADTERTRTPAPNGLAHGPTEVETPPSVDEGAPAANGQTPLTATPPESVAGQNGQSAGGDLPASAAIIEDRAEQVTPDAGELSVDAATVDLTDDESALAGKPNLYLLSIGVTAYLTPELTLEFAAKDARDFAAAWQGQEGRQFRKVTTRVLADGDATKGALLDALDWLEKQVTHDDWAVVFVSGRGLVDARNRYYLAPQDVDLERLKSTGVAWSEFRTTLTHLPGTVLLVLDTCHGADAGEGSKGSADAYRAVLREAAAAEAGLITFASCMPGELSHGSGEGETSAFTQALVEALQGRADGNGDGIVTLAELDAYVSERVKELTGGRQHPTTQRSTSIHSTLPLVRIG